MIVSGGCYCGQIRYKFDDSEIILSAICHCTNCQRLTGGTSVHTIHVPEKNFNFEGVADTFSFTSNTRKHRKRCATCGSQFVSFNEDKKKWSIWGASVDRAKDGSIPESLRPTQHQFYNTRVFDADSSLSKWEGYERTSKQI